MPRKKNETQWRFSCLISEKQLWQDAADADEQVSKGNLSEWCRNTLNDAAAKQLGNKGRKHGK